MADTPMITIEKVTPSQAKAFLARNKSNRPVKQGRVDVWAKEMAAGFWRVTGAPIVFDIEGNVLDGQHRLLACCQANVPFVTAVARGVDSDARLVMDIGASRGPGDVLDLIGVPNARNVASVIRQVIGYDLDALSDPGRVNVSCTRDELVIFARLYPEKLQAAVSYGRRLTKNIGLPLAAWATFSFIIDRADPGEAFPWLEGLIDGAGLTKSDPRLALRSWVMHRISNRQRPTPPEQIYTAVRAWNAFIGGESLLQLKTWRLPVQGPLHVLGDSA